MKSIILVSLLCFLSSQLGSQIQDSVLVLEYYEKGKSFYPKSVDSLEYYYQKGLDLAQEIGYPKGEVTILRSRGAVRGYAGRNTESTEDIYRAIDLIEEYKLPVIERINCLINLGIAYIRAGERGQALENYIVAEELARENEYVDKQAMLLNNIAIIYRQGERHEESISIYKQSEDLRLSLNDSAGLATVYFNMASCYSEMNNAEKHLEYAQRSKHLYQALGQKDEVFQSEAAIGGAMIKMGRINEGVDVLDDLDLSHLDLSMASVSLQYADGLQQLERYDDAEEVLSIIEDELLDSGYAEFKAEWYRLKAGNLRALRNWELAYASLDSFVSLQKTISNENSIKIRQEMEEQFLSKQKDLEIELQETQLEKASKDKLYLIGAFIAAGLLAFQFFRTSSFRKKKNEELQEKNIIIEKALSDKELLLKEIHHRVKNNLQFISALLGLQTDHVSDEVALGALQEGQDRVQSMALIHQDLYQREDLTSVNMKDYFVKLIEGLFDSYNIRNESISLALDVQELNLDVDSVIPIGLIVNELVSNSLKYAFVDQVKGQIDVNLREENNMLHLLVSDNGVGISSNDTDNLGDSLGYKLVTALTEQLQGSMDIDGSSGTKVSLIFKKYQKSVMEG